MLQELWRLFSSSRPTHSSFSQTELRQISEALSHLVLESSAIVRATVVAVDGLARGSFPQQAAEDRISAMSAAMLSLGERICRELDSGDLHYTLIAGAKTLQLLVVLNQDYALELELRRNTSVGSALDALRQSVVPLLQALEIRDSVVWMTTHTDDAT